MRSLQSFMETLKEKYREKKSKWFSCAISVTDHSIRNSIEEEDLEIYFSGSEVPRKNFTSNNEQEKVLMLSLQELIEKTNNFSSKFLIGQGSHARVYSATIDNKTVAIKKLDTPKNPATHDGFMNQLLAASKLRHENFVELLGYSVEGDFPYLAYELATMGSLHDVLHGRKGVQGAEPGPLLSWHQRMQIAYEAAKGLEYLHSAQPPIVHRDIRLSNILLFEDYKVKLADYNIMNQNPDTALRLQSTRILGSFGYYAPEYAMTGHLTQESDIYSFGVVLLELLTGRKPLNNALPKGEQSLINWIIPKLEKNNVDECVDPKLKGNYPPKAAKKFAELGALCVSFEAESRPNLKTLLNILQLLVDHKF